MARRSASAAAKVREDAEAPVVEPSLQDEIEIDLAELNGTPQKQAAPDAEPDIEIAEPTPHQAPPPDDEKETMRKRLQEMEAAEKLTREALARAQSEQAESARLRQEAELRARQYEQNASQAEYDSWVNTIGAATSEIESAKHDLAAARADGRFDDEAAAIDRMNDARWKLNTAEQQKARLEYERERVKPQQAQQPQQVQSVDTIITNSGLPDRAKNWLRAHPDYITDANKNATMQKMHNVAEYQTGQTFTDAYFERMEVLLGFKPETQQQPAASPQPQHSAAPVSAPPTRDAPSMSTGRAPTPTKVTLSPEEREVAASIAQSRGMTQQEAEREYARQKLRMIQEKQAGNIQ